MWWGVKQYNYKNKKCEKYSVIENINYYKNKK